MSSSSSPPRVCVFCGGAKISTEDAWPRWIEKEVPELFHSRGLHLDFGEWGTWRGASGSERLLSTGHIPAKTRSVCRTCNSGWMSDLEQRSKPLLVGMMKGQTRTLYLVSQRIVATWAYKTALMLQEAATSRNHPARKIFPASHYQHLFRHAEPPRQTYIQLFRYEGEIVRLAFRATTRVVPIKQNPGVVGLVYGLSQLVGNLIFVISGYHSVDERWSIKRPMAGSLKDHAKTDPLTIWPPPFAPSVVWPPPQTITGAGFRQFGDSLAAAIEAI